MRGMICPSLTWGSCSEVLLCPGDGRSEIERKEEGLKNEKVGGEGKKGEK